MKIVHTADWHVGRLIRGRSRAAEHMAVLAEIARIADAEAADLVIVAGDLFDSATPTAESEQIVYRALLDLAATGATVLVLAGNHDSDRRLKAVEPLLELGRVVTRSGFLPPADGGVVEVAARRGSERALVACVPFLSRRHVVRADDLMHSGGADQQLLYAERLQRLVGALCAGFTDAGTIHLLAAHAMVAGATTVGSERAGQSVFEYSLPATAFPGGLQYVALGHLHRCQQVPGPVPAWYPGSPLQLDFGETADTKGVLVIEVEPGRPARVRSVPLVAGRRLRVIEGTVAELVGASVGDDWVKARVHEPLRAGLADEVRSALANVVDVELVGDRPATSARGERRAGGRTPHQLFAAYLVDQGVADARIEALFAELLESR